MTYIQGALIPVSPERKDEFRRHAADFATIARELGVERQVEAWADDLPRGQSTDFYRAVDAREGETVVFAWLEYPSREARDSIGQRFPDDPRMQALGAASPFDGKRMVLGGFEAIVEEGSGGGDYVDGFVVPVPQGKREAYRELAAKMAKVFRQHGASRVVEAFGDDVLNGEVTDFYRAVKAEDGESVVFSFIEWPNKAARDEAWKAIMENESLRPQGDMPFDGKRMFWGGFEKIVDTAQPQPVQSAEAQAIA